MQRWFLVLALASGGLAPARAARAQTPAAPSTAPLAVFLDCEWQCDDDLIHTRITYVNWVRDRTVADVHVLVTSQSTGADGEAYTFAFLGQRAAAGRGDTLRYVSSPTSTSDETRRGVVHTLALGLMQFVAHTMAGRQVRIIALADSTVQTARQTTPTHDPWHAWVFELGLDGSTDGERLYHSVETNARISANRTTSAWKTDLDLELSYDNEQTTVRDMDDQGRVTGEHTFSTIQRDWGVDLLVVKSLTRHWSAGLRSSVESNTFRNQKRRVQITPAIEFDVYPYVESTSRQLVFQYGIGYDALVYADTTIFDKLHETLPTHYLSVDYSTRQRWGSMHLGVEHRNYLNDASKRNTQLDGDVEIRLFQGFSVDLGGEYSWIRDQLYLKKGRRDATEILLRQQQLLTGFQYELSMGFSYTFGSIFNNVVNPRF